MTSVPPDLDMSVTCETVFNVFADTIFMYASPIIIFVIVRATVQAICDHTSSLPVALGCGFAAAFTILICIPIHVSKKDPLLKDRFFLLFSVVESHVFGFLLISEIFRLPQWIFLILSYPITHMAMHLQLVTLAIDDVLFFALSDFFLRMMMKLGMDISETQPQTDIEAGSAREERAVFDAEMEGLDANQSGAVETGK